jgi:hypothetical protein
VENTEKRDTLGMTQDELLTYFEELLVLEAQEAAAAKKSSVEEELASPGFAAVRASASYIIQLIDANNAFIARSLLDRGVLTSEPAAVTNAERRE